MSGERGDEPVAAQAIDQTEQPEIAGEPAGSTAPATILLAGAESEGRLAMVEVVLRRADALTLPLHVHHWEDEALYVLAGEVAVWRSPGWQRLGPGGTNFIRRGEEHAVVPLGDDARLLVTLTPAGFEGFYRALGGPAGAVALDRLVALAARYGCEVTGPLPRLPHGSDGAGERQGLS